MIPPPPPQSLPPPTSIHSINTSSSIVNISSNDLNQVISKLKKPTHQHVVDFKERYERAKRMEQDDHSKFLNRKFIYCHQRQEWKRISMNEKSMIEKLLNEMIEFTNDLKIITLNTWFANILQSQRYQEQLNVFKYLNADVIGLQEVIPLYVKDFICKNEFIRNNYIISDVDGSSIDPYGVMILVRKNLPIMDIKITKLTSRMGRCLIHCNFTKNVPTLDNYLKYIQLIENNNLNNLKEELENLIPTYAIIGTVHLESLLSKERRHEQFNEIYSIYNQYPNIEIKMLMGDFNFDSSSIENNQLTNGNYKDYKDIWYHLYPDKIKEGKTRHHHQDSERLDRILLNSENYHPKEIKIIGNEKLVLNEQEEENLKQSFNMEYTCMSDHFGLYSEIQLLQ